MIEKPASSQLIPPPTAVSSAFSSPRDDRLLFRLHEPAERLLSLDFLRGGAIFFMVLLNALYFYEAVPNWLKHAPDDGLTLPDLGVPIFLFALGVSYRISLEKWLEKAGRKKTIFHYILRYLVLWTFGFFGELMVFGHFTWGVLATIGAVGLYCLPLLFLPSFARLVISLLLLLAYQGAILSGVPIYFIQDGLGGPLATFAWGFVVIVAASCGAWMKERLIQKKMISSFLAGLILTLVGFLLSYQIPFNKHKVSLSYIIFTTGLSLIIFLASFILIDVWKVKEPVFIILGKNPLLIYMLSGILTLSFNNITPPDASLTTLLLGSFIILLINYFIASLLARWKISLRV
ncbi:MAG: DUF5009 domain-containing protein [Candidatus Aminicenantes bacterium]|nr:DUF5009 domain-containing protein [Candidatus Aminicenantes bacterium]